MSADVINTTAVPVCHVIKGRVVESTDNEYGPAHARFATPALNLDDLVWSRREPGPAFDVPLAEIMDVLVQTGERLTRDPDGLLAQALDFSARTSPLPRGVLERSYASLGRIFWLRNVVNLIPSVIPYVGNIYGLVDALFIFSESRQCVHDKIADTIVVKA